MGRSSRKFSTAAMTFFVACPGQDLVRLCPGGGSGGGGAGTEGLRSWSGGFDFRPFRGFLRLDKDLLLPPTRSLIITEARQLHGWKVSSEKECHPLRPPA